MSIAISKLVWSMHLPESIPKSKRSTIKLVLLKLSENSDINGKCWPSMGLIAHECELSERTVVRSIKSLSELDIVSVVTKRYNGVKHNTYYLNIKLMSSMKCEYELKVNDDEDNPYKKPTDTQSNPTDMQSKKMDQMSVKSSVTTKEPSHTEHFSKEKRIDVFSLDGYEYCKEAYRFLRLCKTNAENLYTGPLTIEQWDSCESKLKEVLSEPEEVDTLIINIHRDRKMCKMKSISLPYILMSFADVDQFSHLATNCNQWAK